MQDQNSSLTPLESIFAEIADEPQSGLEQQQQSEIWSQSEDRDLFDQLLRGQYSSAIVAKNILDSVAASAGIKCFCAFSIRCGFPVWAAAGIPAMVVLPLLADSFAHIPVKVTLSENSIDNKNSDAITCVARFAQAVSVGSTGYESFTEAIAIRKHTTQSVSALNREIDAAEGKKTDSPNFTPLLMAVFLIVFLLTLVKSKV